VVVGGCGDAFEVTGGGVVFTAEFETTGAVTGRGCSTGWIAWALVWAGAAEEFGVGLGVEGWDERVSRFVALDALGEIFECATGGADFCVCGVGILAAERLEARLGGGWRLPVVFAG
jgi:hypothetical protein